MAGYLSIGFASVPNRQFTYSSAYVPESVAQDWERSGYVERVAGKS